jgi:hypothetical protein
MASANGEFLYVGEGGPRPHGVFYDPEVLR